jgi:plastocyanin
MNVLRCGWRRCVLNVGLLLLALSLPQVLLAQSKASVGAQSKGLGRQALAFLPNEIWIHEGDSVTWTFEAAEIQHDDLGMVGKVIVLP